MRQVAFPKPELHLLVCFNERSVDHSMPSCGPKLSYEEYLTIKKDLRLRYGPQRLKITKTSCLGVCPQEGFIVMVYPKQEYYNLIPLDELKDLVKNFLE